MTLDASLPGHLPNVRLLASACELAYLNEPEGSAGFRVKLGMDARLISVDNTQVYLAGDEGSLVLAFRGSESPTSLDGLKDWLLTNADNLLVVPEGRIGTDFAAAGVGARFHRGFMQALAEVWDPLLEAVEDAAGETERPLWVTGHSLGGAIALLAAWRLQRCFIPVHEVVTFGAPMVGNATAANAFAREFPGRIFRYVDIEDPVPLLPTMSLVPMPMHTVWTRSNFMDPSQGPSRRRWASWDERRLRVSSEPPWWTRSGVLSRRASLPI